MSIVSSMLRQPLSAESKFIDSKSEDYFAAANLLFTNMLLVEFAVEKDSKSSSWNGIVCSGMTLKVFFAAFCALSGYSPCYQPLTA